MEGDFRKGVALLNGRRSSSLTSMNYNLMESANRGFSSYEPASEMKKIRQPLNKLLEGTEILLLKQPSSSQKVKTVRSRSTANFQRPTTSNNLLNEAIAGWAR
jgi:hypothetical protein